MKALRKIMDYYNRLHLLDCNYSQILGRDKYPPECVRINNYLILPNSKEVIFLHGLLCSNNTGSLGCMNANSTNRLQCIILIKVVLSSNANIGSLFCMIPSKWVSTNILKSKL